MFRLETSDVPAFQIEDYMPPANELKYRVDFVYIVNPNPETDFDKFWKKVEEFWYREVTLFVDKRPIMDQAVREIVEPNDTPEAKLPKLYVRAQQIRNLSYEREKSAQEEKRENLKDNHNVEDVLKHGYGRSVEINWLFLALVRAAGFQADPVDVPSRAVYFFNPRMLNPSQLNSTVILVKLDGKDLYLDPGTAFTPFGLLRWDKTRVPGLRVDKEGGGWVTTSAPEPAASRIVRTAVLRLMDTGALEGKVTVTYTGLEALSRRTAERDQDATSRKSFLEEQIKESIPVAAEVQLTNQPEWSSSAPALVAEYELRVPDWAAAAGRRTLFSVGLFGGLEKHTFEHADRVHPIYFNFPHEDDDDLTVELPTGWQIEDTPKPQNVDIKVATYSMTALNKNNSFQAKRQLMLNMELVEPKYYPALRRFFQAVRTMDEQQIVVSSSAAPASK